MEENKVKNKATGAAKKVKAKSQTTKKATSKVKTAEKKTTAKKTVKKSSSKSKSAEVTAKKKSTVPVKKRNNSQFKKDLPSIKQDDSEVEEIDPAAADRGDMPMTVVDHLDEFRSRILIVLGFLILLTIVNFIFSDYLLYYINKPFLETGNQLNIFKLTGGFIIKLKASIGTAILTVLPLLVFHVWRYIVPAIDKNNRMFSRMAIISSVFLFYSGVAFVFFLLLPLIIEVLLGFITSEMLSTIGADDYLSFIFLMCLAMGIIFQLPVIILMLTRIGIISPVILISKRKVAFVIIWIISAMITPPDPFSQSLVAIPLMFLYEISILISKFVVIRKKKQELMSRS